MNASQCYIFENFETWHASEVDSFGSWTQSELANLLEDHEGLIKVLEKHPIVADILWSAALKSPEKFSKNLPALVAFSKTYPKVWSIQKGLYSWEEQSAQLYHPVEALGLIHWVYELNTRNKNQKDGPGKLSAASEKTWEFLAYEFLRSKKWLKGMHKNGPDGSPLHTAVIFDVPGILAALIRRMTESKEALPTVPSLDKYKNTPAHGLHPWSTVCVEHLETLYGEDIWNQTNSKGHQPIDRWMQRPIYKPKNTLSVVYRAMEMEPIVPISSEAIKRHLLISKLYTSFEYTSDQMLEIFAQGAGPLAGVWRGEVQRLTEVKGISESKSKKQFLQSVAGYMDWLMAVPIKELRDFTKATSCAQQIMSAHKEEMDLGPDGALLGALLAHYPVDTSALPWVKLALESGEVYLLDVVLAVGLKIHPKGHPDTLHWAIHQPVAAPLIDRLLNHLTEEDWSILKETVSESGKFEIKSIKKWCKTEASWAHIEGLHLSDTVRCASELVPTALPKPKGGRRGI